MLNRFGEYALQMPRAHDQEPIQALRSSGADEPFCDPIRLGCLNRRPNNSDVFGVKDGIEAARELGIVIGIRKRIGFGRFVNSRPPAVPVA
jgi:hypothetical protein